MQSQAMKLGFIALNLLGRLAIEHGPPKTSKDQLLLNARCAKKVLYAIFFSVEGVAIQVPVKKDRCCIEEIEKKKKNTIQNGAQSWVPNMSDFYMIMPQPVRLPLLQWF